jgi:flagellar basal body rod protein FlgG
VIYGMYLSATGVMTNSHAQDVISNNLANSETSGFKKSMALYTQRQVESQAMHAANLQNPLLDNIGGGQLLAPTAIDFSQGNIEYSSNKFDVAIKGNGFMAVRDGRGEPRLTRAGELMLDNQGNLITAQGHAVMDKSNQPIKLANYKQSELTIGQDGTISRTTQGGGSEPLVTIGLVDSSDPKAVRPIGENLFKLTGNDARLVPATGQLLSGNIERSNVDTATELTQLMQIQRQLEANANMIKFQDATLAKAVNELGKIT